LAVPHSLTAIARFCGAWSTTKPTRQAAPEVFGNPLLAVAG
jgi:hypothetical protein